MRYTNRTVRTHTPIIKSSSSYTRRFALWPRKLDSGSWVWLAHYYITPNANGVGRFISHSEYLEEIGQYNYTKGDTKMVHYNPKLDRSEEFGWKKVCDEHIPTAAEQKFWGRVTVVFAVVVAALVLIVI